MSNREHWATKIGFVLAAAGSAVGLGNIWRFPYVAGENGGAAFVLVYLGCVLVLGLPIMIAELVIGRHTEKSPVGAFKALFGKSGWVLVGYMGVLCGFFILSFYSVVGGWTIGYILKSLTGEVARMGDVETAQSVFGGFVQSPLEIIFFHLLFIIACILIVRKGIEYGIERWSKILMPLLFILLFTLIGRGLTMEGGWEGVAFFLNPDFSQLTGASILAALGQSFFSLSLGMGVMITYGSYLSKNEKILHTTPWIVSLDVLVAILAGLAIFPAVFAMGMSPEEGPGLMFHIIPTVFANMAYGSVFSFLFFLLLFIAALTSGISILEVVVAYVTDEFNWTRKKAVVVVGIAIFLMGIPAALSFGVMSEMKYFFGLNFFDFLDTITSNYMLPIGGFFIAVALGWKYGLEKTIHELDPDTKIISLKELWAFSIKFISPLLLLLVFIVSIWPNIAAFFGG